MTPQTLRPKLFTQVVNSNTFQLATYATGETSVTYTNTIDHETAMQLYVGQPVSVTGGLIVSDAAAATNAITAIAVNVDTTSLDITFTADINTTLPVDSVVTVSGITGMGAGDPNGTGTVTAVSVGANNKVLTVSLLGTGVTVGGGISYATSKVVKHGAGTPLETTVTSITMNASSPPTPTITIADAIPAALIWDNTAAVIKARGSSVNNSDLTYKINEVQLQLYTIKLSNGQGDKMMNSLKSGVVIPFNTYTLERVNVSAIGANLNHSRQFEIDPNCVNVLAINPLVGQDDPFLSRQNHIANFRWNLNGVNTTSRDIVPFDALYYDRLLNSMANGQLPIGNLMLIRDASDSPVWATASASLSMLVLPQGIQSSDRYQTLQVNWQQNGSAGTANILHLYKQLKNN
jgi:hypothetical protein